MDHVNQAFSQCRSVEDGSPLRQLTKSKLYPLAKEDDETYFEIWLDSELTFVDYINCFVRKVNGTTGMLIRHFRAGRAICRLSLTRFLLLILLAFGPLKNTVL